MDVFDDYSFPDLLEGTSSKAFDVKDLFASVKPFREIASFLAIRRQTEFDGWAKRRSIPAGTWGVDDLAVPIMAIAFDPKAHGKDFPFAEGFDEFLVRHIHDYNAKRAET